MKTIGLLIMFSLVMSTANAQTERQIILNDKLSLKNESGDGYKRITITDADMKLADSLTAKYMSENHSKYSWAGKVENYYEYYRQYAGYRVNPSSNKTVFINAFRKKPETMTNESLQDMLLSARGGGSSFFTIKVDLESMTCSDLHVNAPK
jgi:hypothetical protein